MPGLSRQGNLARMAEAAGHTYEQLLIHIMRAVRHAVRPQPGHRWG
nr:hypothetical protein [Streptomyces sp. ISL-98]